MRQRGTAAPRSLPIWQYVSDQVTRPIARNGALLLVATSCSSGAAAAPSYFILDGNPIAARYEDRKLVRLSVQDADTLPALRSLEAVAAITNAPHLQVLTRAQPGVLHVAAPRLPEYGGAMFEIRGQFRQPGASGALAWTGASQFREVVLEPAPLNRALQRRLVKDVRAPIEGVWSAQVAGQPTIRYRARAATARHLAFLRITWPIAARSDIARADYVVDTRSRRTIFRQLSSINADYSLRLFKEPGGPLLMAAAVPCEDGAEPLLLDLDNDTFGTGSSTDVPPATHCFPAQ